MKRKDINNALKEILAAGNLGYPIDWPGVEAQDHMNRPYLEFVLATSDRYGQSLAGTLIRETGRFSISVVGRFGSGRGEDVTNDIADAVGELYPQGLRVTIPNGLVTILQPADVRGGYRDESDWRTPVMVEYSALSQ